MSDSDIITVAITGAAGRITYSLIPLICSGSIFGPAKKIRLRLLDLEVAYKKLEGLKLEIDDSCYELLYEVIITINPRDAFEGADVVVLLGSFPRLPGMERRDLISKNAEGIRSQAEALNSYASKDVKVVVVANPANTNCLVAMMKAGKIPPKNFTCLTRLDHERLRGFIVQKVNEIAGLKLPPSAIQNIGILGNHSATQVPYLGSCTVKLAEGVVVPLSQVWEGAFNDINQMKSLARKLQTRGAEVLSAMGLGSALSAAEAIAKHLKSWLGACEDGDTFSMGILSNGNSLGVPENLVFSFPCRRVISSGATNSGEYEIAEIVQLDPFTKSLLEATTQELLSERSEAESILGPMSINA